MKLRTVMIGLMTVLCLSAFCAIFAQRAQLNNLRAGQQRLLAEQAISEPLSSGNSPEATSTPAPVPSELLRLRNEVARLRERRRELAGVSNENEQLLKQITASTNSGAGPGLPPGYISRRQAQMAGYTTPEATIETFLWAIQHHNTDSLLQALTPEARRAIQQQISSAAGADDFFKSIEFLPGIQVLGRGVEHDGTLEMQLQLIPGEPPSPIQFQLIGSHWAMKFH